MQLDKIKFYEPRIEYIGAGVRHTNSKKSIRKAHRKMFVELLEIMSLLFKGEE